MKNFCEKHHLTYRGQRCPACEKERIASFKVSKQKKTTLIGQASREAYIDEYTQVEVDLESMLAEKFGNVTKLK